MEGKVTRIGREKVEHDNLFNSASIRLEFCTTMYIVHSRRFSGDLVPVRQV